MEKRLNAPQASSSVHLPTALQPSSFTVPIKQGVDLSTSATVGQCMEMIQMAMQQKVATAMGAVYASFGHHTGEDPRACGTPRTGGSSTGPPDGLGRKGHGVRPLPKIKDTPRAAADAPATLFFNRWSIVSPHRTIDRSTPGSHSRSGSSSSAARRPARDRTERRPTTSQVDPLRRARIRLTLGTSGDGSSESARTTSHARSR